MVDDENDSKFGIFWKGFIACRVVSPKDLKLPMKPNRNFFSPSCAKTQSQVNCTHLDEEKAFTGTFTTAEIRKALDLGYKITNVFDAVEYESWAKNDANGEGGLFTSYMNKMIALKIYASGWPSHENTDEEKKNSSTTTGNRESFWITGTFSRKVQDDVSPPNFSLTHS
ncbi:hypothetical protein GCK72_008652 [Caenorhabditis remanei]|uniref:Uncharacterized protein n=1 Tax=Caenorhabditis remanei TaxID=31234 RepID=A0A6A5H189_CAERE|nr:hypothetical protein GCK72_008652 [Caenorhabditis remanei]KAF1760403.1 hypothetical protein GCK72_008652 [Caenorhabditis remanei]